MEGIVQENPVRMNENTVGFEIESERYFVNSDGKQDVETLLIPIENCEAIADKVAENIKKGLTVRIVGRLKPSGCSMAINAEHIEYKISKTIKVIDECNE